MEPITSQCREDETTIDSLPLSLISSILASSELHPNDLAKRLATSMAVSKQWKDAASTENERTWELCYQSRWCSTFQPMPWHIRYAFKMHTIRCYRGSFETDALYSHRASTRCCKLLANKGILVTGVVLLPDGRHKPNQNLKKP